MHDQHPEARGDQPTAWRTINLNRQVSVIGGLGKAEIVVILRRIPLLCAIQTG